MTHDRKPTSPRSPAELAMKDQAAVAGYTEGTKFNESQHA